METTVRADIGRLGALDTGMRATLAEAALILARAIDSYSKQAKTPAELSAIAKAIQELRTVLGKLVEVQDGPAQREPTTPVWDGEDDEPADAGSAAARGAAEAG